MGSHPKAAHHHHQLPGQAGLPDGEPASGRAVLADLFALLWFIIPLLQRIRHRHQPSGR